MNDNPLLQPWVLPPYDAIRAEHVLPAVQHVIDSNLASLAQTLQAQSAAPDWQGLVKPLGDLEQHLQAVLQPVERLALYPGNQALADALLACQEPLRTYHAALNYNATLIGLLGKVYQEAQADLDPTQRAALQSLMVGMRLDATHLAPGSRHRCLVIGEELGELYRAFMLKVEAANRVLASADLTGDTLPSGPHPHDTSAIIRRILGLRAELAQLLGYASYAQMAMATREFDSVEQVQALLWELVDKVRPIIRSDIEALTRLAQADSLELHAGNLGFYQQRLVRSRYEIDSARLSEYFPALTVLRGLAVLVDRLFAVQMRELASPQGLPNTVRLYQLADGDRVLGFLYIDLFDYSGRRGGTWMSGVRDRHRFADGRLQLPVAHISCDFSRSIEGPQSWLDMDQLNILLHEFGHALHHLLTRIDHASVSGTRGGAGDAIEFPSTLFEHWALAPESLMLLSGHFLDGQPMPPELLARLQRYTRHFEAWTLYRLVEQALVDLAIHHPVADDDYTLVEQRILQRTQALVEPTLPVTPFSTHLFTADRYAAGYYAYAWAQILASDAFAAFAGGSVLAPDIAQQVRALILEPGGTLSTAEQIYRLTGRPPGIQHYLQRLGAHAPASR